MSLKKIKDGKMIDYSDVIDMFKNKRKTRAIFEAIDFISQEENKVGKNDLVKFYKSYSLALYNKDKKDWNKNPVFALGEKVGKDKTVPLITEFQFIFSDKNKRSELDEQIDRDEFSRVIIEIHHQLIREFFVDSYEQTQYLCVVCKSRLVRQGDNIVLRARFQFPYCRVKTSTLKGKFRKRLLEELEELDTDDLFFLSTIINDMDWEWENYILPVRDVYPLIGSTDDKNIPPLMVDRAYGELDEDGQLQEYDLNDAFKIDSHQFFQEKYIGDEKIEFKDFEDDYEISIISLPIFLSIFFWEKMSNLRYGGEKEKPEIEPIISESEELESVSVTADNLEDYEKPTDYEIFIELVDCLKPERFNKETYLLDIGKCLYNIFDGGIEGLQHWINYTKEKSTKFEESFCYENYQILNDQNFITIKTIGWYAREDNPERYQNWHDKWCLPKMRNAIARDTFPQVLVAEAFHRVFWLDYFYSGGKDKSWYRFKHNRMCEISEESIRRDITEKFIPCFDKFRNQYMLEKITLNQKMGSSEQAKRMTADFEKTIKIIGQLIDRLYTHHYRSSIMMCIREYFEDEGFLEKIDTNPSLLGLLNCVIELTPTRAVARTGKPEDYVTNKMGVSYRSDYDYNSQDVKDVLKYLRQVFPEESIFRFMLKDIAAMLYGRNIEKSFRIWIGNTNGSKSIFQLMLKKMFGDYYKDLPSAWFSQTKINVSGSSPEFAQLAGSRVVFSPEPDAGLDFRADRIKILTGGDSTFGRGNFKDGGSINPSYNAIMPLNRIPNIANLDEAAKERFTMIPFEGRWFNEEDAEEVGIPDDYEEQVKERKYIKDKMFDKQVPRLAMALLWLSVENYSKYKTEGHTKPEYIKSYMRDYWMANDPYLCFIDEMLVKKEKEKVCKKCDGDGCEKCKGRGFKLVVDKSVGLRTKEVFPVFKKWLKKGDHSLKLPKQGEFTTVMSTRDKLDKQVAWVWQGYTWKEDSLDSEDEE